MTETPGGQAPQDGLTAALLRLTEHAARIGALDEREGQHFSDVAHQLSKLRTTVTGMQGTLTDQGEILGGLNGLDDTVVALADRLATLLPPDAPCTERYEITPTAPWWDIDDSDREEAVARLSDWVGFVYRPCYGHLAARLGDCWEEHPLCLMVIDWLSQLWGVLYLSAPRTERDLRAQSEFAIRVLPAAAEQFAAETTGCEHSARTASVNGRRGGGVR